MKKHVVMGSVVAASLVAGSAFAGTLVVAGNTKGFVIANEVIKGQAVTADIGDKITSYTPTTINLPGGLIDPLVNGTLLTVTLSDPNMKFQNAGNLAGNPLNLEVCKIAPNPNNLNPAPLPATTDKIAGYVSGFGSNVLVLNGTAANAPEVNGVAYGLFLHGADGGAAGNCQGGPVQAGDIQVKVAQVAATATPTPTTIQIQSFATINTGNVPQDTSNTANIISFDQGLLAAVTTPFSKVIDTQSTPAFTKFTDGTNTDTATISVTANAVDVPVAISTADTLTVKIYPQAPFDGLFDATGKFLPGAKAEIADTNGTFTFTGCNAAADVITCTGAPAAAITTPPAPGAYDLFNADQINVTLTTSGVITAKSFTASVEYAFDAASNQASDTGANGLLPVKTPSSTQKSAGAWTVNGFTGTLPYLYRGTLQDLTTYCLINNAGGQDANVFFTPKTVDGGTTVSSLQVGTVASGASRLMIISGQNTSVGNAAAVNGVYFSDAPASAASLAGMGAANRYSAQVLVTGTPKTVTMNCQQLDPSGAKRLLPVLVDDAQTINGTVAIDPLTGAGTLKATGSSTYLIN